jgi:hypothetical protein
MKAVPFYHWWYVDPDCGVVRYTATYRMDPEEALRRFPGAQPDVDTIEWRDLPERPAEWQSAGFPRRE